MSFDVKMFDIGGGYANGIASAGQTITNGLEKFAMTQEEQKYLDGKVDVMKNTLGLSPEALDKYYRGSLAAKRGMASQWETAANLQMQRNAAAFNLSPAQMDAAAMHDLLPLKTSNGQYYYKDVRDQPQDYGNPKSYLNERNERVIWDPSTTRAVPMTDPYGNVLKGQPRAAVDPMDAMLAGGPTVMTNGTAPAAAQQQQPAAAPATGQSTTATPVPRQRKKFINPETGEAVWAELHADGKWMPVLDLKP